MRIPQPPYGHSADPLEPHCGDRKLYTAGSRVEAIATSRQGVHDCVDLLILTQITRNGQSAVLGAAIATVAPESIWVFRQGNPDASHWSLRALIGRIFGKPIEMLAYRQVAAAVAMLTAVPGAKGHVAIAVAAAQTLADRALKDRLLATSPARSRAPLLQLVLAGYGTSGERQRCGELHAITGQAAIRVLLKPLAPSEAVDYFAFRMEQADDTIDNVLTPGVLTAILRHSTQIPDEIDQVDRILEVSSAIQVRRGGRPLTGDVVEDAIASLALAPERPVPVAEPIAAAIRPVRTGDRPNLPRPNAGALTVPAATPAPACAPKFIAVAVAPAVQGTSPPAGLPIVVPPGIAKPGAAPLKVAPEWRRLVRRAAVVVLIASFGGIAPGRVESDGRVTDAIARVLLVRALPASAMARAPTPPPQVSDASCEGSRPTDPDEALGRAVPLSGPAATSSSTVDGMASFASVGGAGPAPVADGDRAHAGPFSAGASAAPSVPAAPGGDWAGTGDVAPASAAEAAVIAKPEAEFTSTAQDIGADASAPVPAANSPSTQPTGAKEILADRPAVVPTPEAPSSLTIAPVGQGAEPMESAGASDSATAIVRRPPAASESGAPEAGAATPLTTDATVAAKPGQPRAAPRAEAATDPEVATATTAPAPDVAMHRPDPIVPPDAGAALASPASRSSPAGDAAPAGPASAAITARVPEVGTAVTPPAPNPPPVSPTPMMPSAAAAITQLAPAPARPAATTPLSPDMVAALLRRGHALLQQGDVSAARLLYERAAASGSGPGATGAGKTYDPAVLARIDARGLRGDAARAADWYVKAISLGDSEAGQLLKALPAPPGP